MSPTMRHIEQQHNGISHNTQARPTADPDCVALSLNSWRVRQAYSHSSGVLKPDWKLHQLMAALEVQGVDYLRPDECVLYWLLTRYVLYMDIM